MKVVFSKECLLHDPPFEVLAGEKVPYFEKPKRLTLIEDELRSKGFEISEELDWNIGLKHHILCVHSAEYLEYLETAHESWVKQGGNEVSLINFNFKTFSAVCTHQPLGRCHSRGISTC